MPELFTWGALVTAAGTVAAANVVALVVKALAKPRAAILRYVVVMVCLLVQGVNAYTAGPQKPETYIVAIFNAAVCALAAMGLYEKVKHGWSAKVTGPTSGA